MYQYILKQKKVSKSNKKIKTIKGNLMFNTSEKVSNQRRKMRTRYIMITPFIPEIHTEAGEICYLNKS